MCVGGRTTAIYGGELSSFLRKIIFRWQRLLEVRPAAQKTVQAAFFRFPSPSQAAFARSAAFRFLIETLRPVLPNQYDTLTFQRKSTYGFRP